MPEESETKGRLSRWSKRKLAVAKDEKSDQNLDSAPVVDPEEVSEQQAILLANREAAEAVDLETLNEDSDFSVFLKEGVPELLKKKAMQTLWRSNPVFANIDGLCDYDDDFASPDLILKTFKSAYTAGKGYLHLLEEEEDGGDPSTDAVVEDETDTAEDEEDNAGSKVEQATENTDGQSVREPLADLEAENTEPEPAPDITPPKVSLRRRLQLESES